MKATPDRRSWQSLERDIVACVACPRLVSHCREVARVRRRAYRDHEYWGRPVPGFGDRGARILLLGLAPAAHGANRTGRMFTGDRSGEWLFGALHGAKLATRSEAVRRDDGLRLRGAFISAACRCAPPANRPTRDEMGRCAPFLDREIELLNRIRVVIALGGIAWDTAMRRARKIDPAGVPRPRPRFGHGARVRLPFGGNARPVDLLGCYHPSQQNTQTGRLTRRMLNDVIHEALVLAGPAQPDQRANNS